MNGTFKYRAFLSYSHHDRRWADWLHRALETYRVPKRLAEQRPGERVPRRLVPIFRDREELPSAADLSAAVTEALEQSEALIVICSPHAAASRWVDEEIRVFKRLRREDRIFCLIVDGEPNSRDERECFPEALRFRLGADGTLGNEPAEPIAADARPSGDGHAHAKLKLIAGLLGVGLDELRRRELQRRNRRLLAITSGSIAVMLVTVTLAILAILARSDAERRRAQAEDLIGFMLGDLQERLQEIGRLDVFVSVSDKAMEYFAALTDEDVTDRALAQRATALRQIGEVRMDQGDLASALEAFRESLVLSRRLAVRNRTNPESQIALANSHFWIGYVHWQRGDLEAARTEFETELPIVDRVVAGEPDNTEWLVERGYAYTNFGRVLELQNRLEQALAAYRTVLAVNERLVELEPNTDEWQLEVGFAHNNIGKLVTSLGRLAEAEEHFRADYAVKKLLSERNPQHNLWHGYLATSHAYMGRILNARGAHLEATEHYKAASEITQALLAVDSSNTVWLRREAIYGRELGASLRRTGDLVLAYRPISASVETLSRLVTSEPDNALWQGELAMSRIEAAWLEADRGNLVTASELAEAAHRGLRALLEQEPTNRQTRARLATAALAVGEIAAERGEFDGARAAWLAVLEIVESTFAGSADPNILDIQAAALARLGRGDEAAAVFARLRTMGFSSSYAAASDTG